MTKLHISAATTESLKDDFNSYISEEVQREKFASLGNYNEEKAKIHFYEWSSLLCEKQFNTDKDFFKFLLDCKIYTTWQEDREIKGMSHIGDGAYVICKPNCTKLIIANNFWTLRDEFNKVKAEIDKPTMEVTTVTPEQSSCPPTPALHPNYPCCMYPQYGDEYSDYWDY